LKTPVVWLSRASGGEIFPVTFLLIGQGIAHLDSLVGSFMIDGGTVWLGRDQLLFQVLTVETVQTV
jgi:hypothetical protein